ncbi:MAG: glycosyltransferase [Hyphomicrobiaceae bacterium]
MPIGSRARRQTSGGRPPVDLAVQITDVKRIVKLLHVVPTYLPAVRYGGPIYSVHAMCRALVARGHEVHVYTTNVDGEGVSQVPLGIPVNRDGVHVWYFPTSLGRRLYRSAAMHAALAKTVSDFSVVHAHSVFLWPTLAASAAARRANVPFVVAPRGMLVADLIQRKSRLPKSLWIALFERRTLAKAAAVHVTSRLEADDLAKLGFRPRRVAIIPNGIALPDPAGEMPDCCETTRSDPRPVATSQAPTLLTLGRINWKKGLDKVIEAMPEIPMARLIIAGNDEEGYLASLKALVARNGLTDRVSFPGPVYGAEKWKLSAAADVFVMASRSENFGIAALEAMASGVPVIVAPGVGLAETVAQGEAGLVVEALPSAIASAARRLLDDPALRERMGRAGRRMAQQKFSWSAIAEATEKLYIDLAGSQHRP